MPHTVKHKTAAGIVAKLRIAIAAALLLFLVGFLYGKEQLRQMNNTVSALTNSATDVLVDAEGLERRLKELVLLQHQTKNVKTRAQLTMITMQMDHLFNQIAFNNQPKVGSQNTDSSAHRVTRILADIEIRAHEIVMLMQQNLRQDRITSDLIEQLNQTRGVVLKQIEDHTYSPDFLTPLHGTVDRMEGDFDGHFHELMRATAITSIGVEMAAIMNVANSLPGVTDPKILKQIEADLRFKIGDITSQLAKLPANDARRQIAQNFVTIRNVLFAKDGLLASIATQQKTAAMIQEKRTAQIRPINSISSLSQKLTQSAQVQIKQAREDLITTSNTLVLEVTVVGIASMLAIFGFLFFIVEKQLNTRIANLTMAVTEIAAGNLDHPVNVGGADELGKMANALGVFKQNAKELMRSNEELEKFAYAAAHDLRTPLRGIRHLTEWIEEDEDSKLSPISAGYLATMRTRVKRLSQLLTGLLDYSQVGKNANTADDVNIADMVVDISDLVDPDHRFSVRYTGVKTPVRTYVHPLNQLLLNLISNAIKHHDKDHGIITVHAEQRQGRIHCSVHDDGPGIEAQYHDKVFELFQTLRPRDEIEGSGLGLAFIKKTVEHLDGKINIISNPHQERGTLMTFDLPDEHPLNQSKRT